MRILHPDYPCITEANLVLKWRFWLLPKLLQRTLQALVISLQLSTAFAIGTTDVGNMAQIVLPLSALAISAYKDDYEGGKQALASGVVTQAVVLGMKHQFKVTRPNGENDLAVISGHTALAFVAAGYLEERYGWRYSAMPYALAAFTGYSRVKAEEHTWGQVIAGAALGQVAAYYFTKPYREANEHNLNNNNFTLMPKFLANNYSVHHMRMSNSYTCSNLQSRAEKYSNNYAGKNKSAILGLELTFKL